MNIQRHAIASFRLIKASRACQSGPLLQPPVHRARLQQREATELLDGRRRVLLLQIETAQIVTHRRQLVVQRQGHAIRLDGLLRLLRRMISQAEVVRGQRILWQQHRGPLQGLHRLRILSFIQQTLALQERARAGRRTTQDEQTTHQPEQPKHPLNITRAAG